MSRATFTSEKFVFAFGVDHTAMGTFFQIWYKYYHGENSASPDVEADSLFGVVITREEFVKEHAPEAWDYVQKIKAAGLKGKNLTEEDIIAVGKGLGITNPNFEKKVYELWD
jgi:hypothetical protein